MPKMDHVESIDHPTVTALDVHAQLNTRNVNGSVSPQETYTSTMTPNQIVNLSDIFGQENWSPG
jgi:hypothetical protein